MMSAADLTKTDRPLVGGENFWLVSSFFVSRNDNAVVLYGTAASKPVGIRAVTTQKESRLTMRLLTTTVTDFVADRFAHISEVTCVWINRDGDILYVTVLTSSRDDAVLDKIMEEQQRTMDEFQQFQFDFSVIFQNGKSITDLITTTEAPVYQRA
jgi:hypothetical protein